MRTGVGSIPCHVALARLWAFIDGELEPDSADEVRSHLEVCKRCYPQYDFQRAYFERMRRLGARPEPPELRARVFDCLLVEAAGSEFA